MNEGKETLILTHQDLNGVVKTFTVTRDGILLGEVAELFTDFLIAAGWDYVTGVSIETEGGRTQSYTKGQL